ncbi:MAG: DNA repair exonuclease [Treponema sp.]|nr:DNA repair exonuclease [Treponema sp.]
MKIIHCADIHADSKMGTHYSKEQTEERRNEIVDSFSRMVEYAKKNSVRAIIIAGDLFDSKETQQKKIKQRIGYIILQNPEIDFLYLRGNHDEDVCFLADNDVPNLKRFTKNKWDKYSYENIDIYGREFGNSIPVSTYNELALDSTHVNILVMHGQIAEYRAKDGAPVISLPKFANKNIDYIALGHIHDFKKEKLDQRCSWCYSGCLEGRGFDECGKKGFVVLDITDNKIQTEFVSVAKRTIHEINVNISGLITYDEIMNAISEKITDCPSSDIIEIVLCGEISEETEVETESYQSALSAGYYLLRVKDKTETKIDYAKYENDVSLKGEFIRLVKEQQDLSDEEKSKIIMTGIKALAGRLN